MKLNLLTIIFILLFSANSIGQKKPQKTVQQQAKEFTTWFKTLNENEKKSASKGLVDKLNTLDAESRATWLLALESLNGPKKIEPKKVIVKLTDSQIESELIKSTNELISNPETRYFYFDPAYFKVQSIIIKDRVSNKDRADKYNSILQHEIDSISNSLVQLKDKRTKLKAEIPEGYKPMYEDNLEYDNQGKKINDTIKPKYIKFNGITSLITTLTHQLAEYPEKKLKNDSKHDWDDTTKNRFLIEVTVIPLNGLDDVKPEVYSFMGFYIPIGFNGENSKDYAGVKEAQGKITHEQAVNSLYSVY